MKHERNIKPAKKHSWRLKKTLARRVEVRPMEPDDLKYLWAAYKMGGLGGLGEPFTTPDMSADDFRAAFDQIAVRFSEAWMVLADTRKGFMPAGIVFGAVAPMAAYMIVAGIAWFPWATRRNIVEGTVAFFNIMRRQIPMMGYATGAHKRMYEICCIHGVMSRVGTSFVVFPGAEAAVFETRAPKQ